MRILRQKILCEDLVSEKLLEKVLPGFLDEVFLGDNVGGGGGDAAVVVLLRHQDVAVVAPVRGPGVLDQPELLAVELAVADSKNSVILKNERKRD